jgi:integrase
MLVMGTEFGYAEPMTTLSTTPTTTPRYSSEAVVLQRRSVQLRREQLHELSEQAQLELADEWLRSFPSVNTRDAYARDFQAFRFFLSALGVRNFGEVTRADGNEYRNYLDELKDPAGRPYSQATKHRKLASVASFYDYCLAEQLLPHLSLR